MPSNVADRVQTETRENNRYPTQPLSKSEQKTLAESLEKFVYIYNVSKIDQFTVKAPMGHIIIAKCERGKQLSEPCKIPAKVRRRDFNGVRFMEWLEDGLEMAQDLCQCSPDYVAGDPANNLTSYGVFITEKPFEELSKSEQFRILGEATTKYKARIKALVLQGDELARNVVTEKFVGPIHRAAFAESGEKAEKHPWAGFDDKTEGVDCIYCGFANKPGVPKCANCKEILNPELYRKLQAQSEPKGQAKA